MQLQCEHERVHIGAARHDDADDTDDTDDTDDAFDTVDRVNCFYGLKQQLIVRVHGVDHVDHVDHGW